MSKTNENLKAAFAGESQANRKYLAFAQKAAAEGNNGLAKIFKVAAEGETIHALTHLQNLAEVGSSDENLKTAIAGETYEIDTMYPAFIAEVEEADAAEAKIGFIRAKKVEEVHQKMFQEALAKLERGEEFEEKAYHICQVCGYPSETGAPDRCPVCGAEKEKFFLV